MTITRNQISKQTEPGLGNSDKKKYRLEYFRPVRLERLLSANVMRLLKNILVMTFITLITGIHPSKRLNISLERCRNVKPTGNTPLLRPLAVRNVL